MSRIKVSRKNAKSIIDATFPEYNGRKVAVEFTESVTFYDTNWGGGTRNVYKALNSNGRVSKLPAPAPWVNPVEGLTVQLPIDCLIVEHSIFCGKDVGITIYSNPLNAPKWLGSGSKE